MAESKAWCPRHGNSACWAPGHCLDDLQPLGRVRVRPSQGPAARAARNPPVLTGGGCLGLRCRGRRPRRRGNLAWEEQRRRGVCGGALGGAAQHVLQVVPGLVLRCHDGETRGDLGEASESIPKTQLLRKTRRETAEQRKQVARVGRPGQQRPRPPGTDARGRAAGEAAPPQAPQPGRPAPRKKTRRRQPTPPERCATERTGGPRGPAGS